MNALNRMALIIRPKQPYVDWANSFDDGGPKFDLNYHRPNVYLIDEVVDPSNLQKVVGRYWREIFEEELQAWMRYSEDWPQRRTLTVFMQWLDVEVAEIVTDLGKHSIWDE